MTAPQTDKVHLLYLTAEQWPTFRPDLVALFGKYLPPHGVTCDLVTEREVSVQSEPNTAWGGGRTILCKVPRHRAGHYLAKLWHNLHVLFTMDTVSYSAIQVRDMPVVAMVGLVVARLRGMPFYYWLSYPQSEGQIDRAKARGLKGGLRFWFPLLQGIVGKWLLYCMVLPRADHVFVQSRQMQVDIAGHGIPLSHMTPVPMGVDTEIVCPEDIQPADDARLVGKRVLVYLGTLNPPRQIEVLLQMLVHARATIPDILLVLVGDTDDAAHRVWLKQEAVRLGVAELLVWTGWLDASVAWRYARAAEVGLSPIPRGYLLDMGSPTKAIEYMALGLPVVANDNPDQAQVIAESGGGLCVMLTPPTFAEAVIRLLSDDGLRHAMGKSGRKYVIRTRAYEGLAIAVAAQYHALQSGRQS